MRDRSHSPMDRLIAENREAAREFLEAAEAHSDWSAPLAAGKWSVAQQVEHVGLAYAAAVREANGEGGMRLLGNRAKRLLWRAIGLTAVTVFKRLPPGATAPRETRPVATSIDKATLVAELERQLDACEAAVRAISRDRPEYRFTHPYFGSLSLESGLRLLAVHTRHHRRQLTSRRSQRSPIR